MMINQTVIYKLLRNPDCFVGHVGDIAVLVERNATALCTLGMDDDLRHWRLYPLRGLLLFLYSWE